MKGKMKKENEWKEAWMKVQILIVCPKHRDIQRVASLKDYDEALENKSRKKMWFCIKCGKRLVRSYGDINFILKDDFNTREKK